MSEIIITNLLDPTCKEFLPHIADEEFKEKIVTEINKLESGYYLSFLHPIQVSTQKADSKKGLHYFTITHGKSALFNKVITVNERDITKLEDQLDGIVQKVGKYFHEILIGDINDTRTTSFLSVCSIPPSTASQYLIRLDNHAAVSEQYYNTIRGESKLVKFNKDIYIISIKTNILEKLNEKHKETFKSLEKVVFLEAAEKYKYCLVNIKKADTNFLKELLAFKGCKVLPLVDYNDGNVCYLPNCYKLYFDLKSNFDQFLENFTLVDNNSEEQFLSKYPSGSKPILAKYPSLKIIVMELPNSTGLFDALNNFPKKSYKVKAVLPFTADVLGR